MAVVEGHPALGERREQPADHIAVHLRGQLVLLVRAVGAADRAGCGQHHGPPVGIEEGGLDQVLEPGDRVAADVSAESDGAVVGGGQPDLTGEAAGLDGLGPQHRTRVDAFAGLGDEPAALERLVDAAAVGVRLGVGLRRPGREAQVAFLPAELGPPATKLAEHLVRARGRMPVDAALVPDARVDQM